MFFRTPHKTVILRACDFFDLSVFLTPQPDVFNLHHKTVILSEALRRSIANKGLYSAESKDPGDACWQMLLGAFRPQTTPEDKKSQALSEAPHRFIACYSAWWRGVEEPVLSVAEGTPKMLILSMLFGAFRLPKPRT